MKKIINFCLLLMLMFTLVGCGNKYEVSIGIGNGNVEDDAVNVNYVINDKITDNYVIKGNIKVESKAVLDESYVFSISTIDPLMNDNFEEHVLLSVRKSDLEALKTKSGYDPFKFEINLGNLESLFPKDSKTNKIYLVFHKENWTRGDIFTYGYSTYTYEWKNNKVLLEH